MKKIITAIIAHMPISNELLNMTRECVSAFRPLVDKIILIQNGTTGTVTNADSSLIENVDHYIINKENRLHGGAINQGILLAKPGEYLAIINDDILPKDLTREAFEDLCVPGEIWSPKIGDQDQSLGAHASFFVCDYETFNEVGWWDLSLGHVADVDWFGRAIELGIIMNHTEVRVVHDHPTATISKVVAPKFEKGEY